MRGYRSMTRFARAWLRASVLTFDEYPARYFPQLFGLRGHPYNRGPSSKLIF